MLTYGSVCSGIEAASVAWHPLGWRAAFLSEIDAFPRAILKHHYPDTPLHGDFTTIRAEEYAAIDLLVGGTPCQSFSVAGLRGGLADDRGNLALQFLALAQRTRPRWLVWENVPGVLSSNGGRDFGSILGGMVELGYGVAYRVLDAQYVRVDGFGRAVPQRRRRVFVVGYLGDWRRAAAVLFERESLCGHPAPSREAGQGVARPIASCPPGGSGYRNDADTAENLIAFGGNNTSGPLDVATAVNAHGGPHGRQDFESETFVVAPPLTSNPYGDHESREGLLVAHSLRAEGFDASEDGTGRGTPLVPVPYTLAIRGRDGAPDLEYRQDGTANAILAPNGGRAGIGVGAVAFTVSQNATGFAWESDVAATLQAHPESETSNQFSGIRQGWAVRRLTPRECERLQGFPDGYTDVPFRSKPAADGPRYKALGNSMAVNAMRWIGRRIEAVEALHLNSTAEAA